MSEQRLITKSLLTKIADAIRSKLGTTSTYTPDEMATAIEEIETGTDVSDTTATASGVVDGAIFYTADGTRTEGTLEITSITPSTSYATALSSGNTYKPTSDGYAIKEFNTLTVSSTPVYTNYTFNRFSNSGYAVLNINYLTPSTLSSLGKGYTYYMNSVGYCISSYSSSSKSPSSSGTSFSSGWNYMNSSGYAYSSQPAVGASGTLNFTSTNYKTELNTGLSTINGICFTYWYSSSYFYNVIYSATSATNMYFGIYYNSGYYGRAYGVANVAREYHVGIISISGGTITITAPTVSNYGTKATTYWWAY